VTLFARIVANAVQQSSPSLPGSWRFSDGRTVSNPTLVDLAPDGWVEATEVRPALGAGQRHGPPTFTVNGSGAVTATYPAQDPPAEETNGNTIRTQAGSALAGNRTYLALATPTAAQTTAQVRSLTQQIQGVIRLVLGQLDGTN